MTLMQGWKNCMNFNCWILTFIFCRTPEKKRERDMKRAARDANRVNKLYVRPPSPSPSRSLSLDFSHGTPLLSSPPSSSPFLPLSPSPSHFPLLLCD